MPRLLCRNCGGLVVFGPDGWDHDGPHHDCPRLLVAWPPPLPSDD